MSVQTSNKVYFKQLLDSLKLKNTAQEQETILFNIQTVWGSLYSSKEDVSTVLQDNYLFQTLADVMVAKMNTWSKDFPERITYLLNYSKSFNGAFSPHQINSLVAVYRSYVMRGYWGCMRSFSCLVNQPVVQQSLLSDDELYNKIKPLTTKVPYVPQYFVSITDGCDEWQFKILSDKPFVNELQALQGDIWGVIFCNLAQHPDAKTLLPSAVVNKASEGKTDICTLIGALLSNDNDLPKFQIGVFWIERTVKVLDSLVHKGYATTENQIVNLLDVLLPIANLSVVEPLKESLGGKSVVLLLKIVTEKMPEVRWVTPFLARGRQEASRALWNFAYKESNCELIRKANGIDKLLNTLAQTDDLIVHKNIEGVLYMLAPHLTAIPGSMSSPSVESTGHVMISYNWSNQETIIKLSDSLKQHGYSVWLDIERMGGSTLDAMAQAIEHAELVLICMSQKYKDSPNCRLEGEYCVSRRVKYIPLMMQQGYKPDGWLGITLGSKLYYDFSDLSNWDFKIAELVKALGDTGKALKTSNSSIVPPPSPTISRVRKSVSEWTSEDIKQWLSAEKLSKYYDILQEQQFTGPALLEMKTYISTHPKVFFMICKEIGITVYGDVLKLSAAIRKLQ